MGRVAAPLAPCRAAQLRPRRRARGGARAAADGHRHLDAGPPAGPADRGRHRAAQLRRGAGDRAVRGRAARSRWPRCWSSASRCTTPPRASGSPRRWPATSTPTARRRRPSWPFLLGLGLIGGGPTFVGTAIGHGFTSERLSVAFLTLAAGSLIYVITQLLGVAAKAKRADLLAYGLLIGLFAGFLTDAIVTAAGV